MLRTITLLLATSHSLWQIAYCQGLTNQIFNNTGLLPCDVLVQAGLGEKVFFPDNDEYQKSMSYYYSVNNAKRPWCILQPHNTQDISVAMQALSSMSIDGAVGGLAIRSGGHGAADGASGIANGVTIDMGVMNHTSYNPSTSLASIESGARWMNVYAALSPYNVTVAGGRDGDVGVGGLLLGGGISYYASRTGLSVDSVVNFEVVLANGTVVNANQTHCSDLWKALKGGTNNFGVVTRFDTTTVTGQDLAYSLRTISSDQSDSFVDALVQFTGDNNNAPDDAIIAFYTHIAGSPGVSITLIEVNTRGMVNSTTFNHFNSIPANLSADTVLTLAEAAENSQYPGGPRAAASTLTIKKDARVVKHIVQLHDEYVAYLSDRIGAENFTTTCFLEPFPASIERIGREKGGNVVGLPKGEDLFIVDIGTLVTTDDVDLAIIHAALMRLTAQVKEYAVSVGQDVDFTYANYADASQDVMGSYGSENVQFMRTVAERYDPMGFFQKRVPGGWKLGVTETSG